MAALESMSGMEAASQISRLGQAGPLAGGQSHRAWCLRWMQHRGVVPGAGQEQHGEAGPTMEFWPPDIRNWVGDLAPPLSHAAGSDPGLANSWLCDTRQVQILPEPQFPQL